jgi:hypothetical protein
MVKTRTRVVDQAASADILSNIKLNFVIWDKRNNLSISKKRIVKQKNDVYQVNNQLFLYLCKYIPLFVIMVLDIAHLRNIYKEVSKRNSF